MNWQWRLGWNSRGVRPSLALDAFEELAIHYEHHRRDPQSAMEFTLAALERLREQSSSLPHAERLNHRLKRLRLKTTRLPSGTALMVLGLLSSRPLQAKRHRILT